MAEQSFPFENVDTTESQFSQWATNFQDTGVQGSPADTKLKVTAEGSTLSVNVASGQAFIRGHYYINTDSIPLTLTTAGLDTRIDYVVIELDPALNTIAAKIVQGTAVASDPVAPTLTQTDTGIYQLPVALITIPNSTLAVTNEMITDVRTFMSNRVGIWTTATRPTDPTNFQTIGYNTTEEYHEYWNGTAWIPFVPPAASPNFVIEIDGANTLTTFTESRQAGPYAISTASGDVTYDIYFLDSLGNVIAYTNSAFIDVPEAFFGISIVGVEAGEKVTFLFTGSVTEANNAGTATKAGAYLSYITPSTLPAIDDTATVVGGNFATDVELFFESGETSLPAKNIVRNSATELIVTRPDELVEDLSPYNLRVNNPSTQVPVGSNAHILFDGVSAGTDPVFVTTSPILGAYPSQSFTSAIEVTDDSEVVLWEVISGTFPPGLTLNSSTGAITGTPTTAGDYTFTVRVTDDGGNTSTETFNLPVGVILVGATISGGYQYARRTTSGNITIKNPSPTIPIEYVIVAGGGAGGRGDQGYSVAAGGGGAGGIISGSSVMNTTVLNCAVGGGGNSGYPSNGSNSAINTFSLIATGGGNGATAQSYPVAGNGGSGGGAARGTTEARVPGTGISGQGFAGGGVPNSGGGGGAGGGFSQIGGNNRDELGGIGGNGTNSFATWLTAFGYTTTSGYLAGGGGGGSTVYETTRTNVGGLGGGGTGGSRQGTSTSPVHYATSGETNSGGGGGGGANSPYGGDTGGAGGSGVVMIRVAI